jgi:deferrochelatase/peroxidase EfeB
MPYPSTAATSAAARMSTGKPVGRGNDELSTPQDDTGETLGLKPARLTLAFGFGPSLFERDGQPRFGLAGLRPAPLIDLPEFNSDVLDPARSDGDIAATSP